MGCNVGIVVDMSRIQIARSEINMAAESIAHSALISLKEVVLVQ